MADNNTNPGKLPPLSPRSKSGDVDNAVKPARKKKKKAVTSEAELDTDETTTRPTPKRRRSAASSDIKTEEGAEMTTENTPVKKKKKKAKPKTDIDQTTTENNAVSNEEVTGSKASLIGKEGEERTPRKKKKKKVKKTVPEEDEYADSGLAADLTSIDDDIIKDDQNKEHVELPHTTNVGILKSQPMEKIYVETIGGFQRKDRAKMAKRQITERIAPERESRTPMQLALVTIHILKTFSLFVHGLTAGLAMWQIVTVYVLSSFGNVDFLEHYYVVALPVQCTAYLLLALCIVSVCDRCDIGCTTRQFWFQAVTLQNGAVSILFYLTAVILSLSIVSTEDRMHLYSKTPDLWKDPAFVDSELSMWRNINTARGVFAMLGWVVITITPNADRLSKNLSEDNDNVRGGLTPRGVVPA